MTMLFSILRASLVPALLMTGACGGGGGAPDGSPLPLPPGWERVAAVPQQPATEVLLREPAALLAAGGSRVYRSTDGTEWTALPELPPDIDVASLSAAGNRYWAGTFGERGVYALTADEAQWRRLADGLTGAGARTVLGFAARDRQLYAATAGAGLFRRSIDDEGPWRPDRDGIPSNLSWNVDAVVLHQGRIVAGAGGNAMLYIQQADGGVWREVAYDVFDGEARQLSALLDRGAVLLAGGNRRLYRSIDAGETWTATPAFSRLASRVRFAVSHDGRTIYAMISGGAGTQLQRSGDDGASWQPVNTDLRGVQGFDVAVLGSFLYLAHAGGFWRTSLD